MKTTLVNIQQFEQPTGINVIKFITISIVKFKLIRLNVCT